MIEVAHLSKSFGGRQALDDVSFRAEAGRVTAFLGPNGAGKSTAMRIILGLDKADAGFATIDGKPFSSFENPLSHLGALIDSRFAHPKRTAFDHLRVVAMTHGYSRTRIHEVIESTGLESVASERVGGFSLGMNQRLGIATALLGNPRVLMLDEPLNGLDIDGIQWFRQLCRDQADRGVAVFLSSHIMSEVELVADSVVILGKGKVLLESPLTELTTGAERIEVFGEPLDALAAACAERGATVTRVPGPSLEVAGLSAHAVGMLARDHGVSLSRLAEKHASLEERYRELTKTAVQFQSRS